MILVGLVLGGYVYAAWPDGVTTQATPVAKSPVRATASVDSYPDFDVAGIAGAFYPGELFAYELGPTPFLDTVIAAPALGAG